MGRAEAIGERHQGAPDSERRAADAGAPAPLPAEVLALQRAAGNRAVAALLGPRPGAPGRLQRVLTVAGTEYTAPDELPADVGNVNLRYDEARATLEQWTTEGRHGPYDTWAEAVRAALDGMELETPSISPSSHTRAYDEDDERKPAPKRKAPAEDVAVAGLSTDLLDSLREGHEFAKDDQSKACFEWVVRAFSNDAPAPEAFFRYLSQLDKEEKVDLGTRVTDALKQEIDRLMNAIANIPPEARRGDKTRVQAINQAIPDAVKVLLQLSGFELADRDEGAVVAVHYKAEMGVGIPDHWWFEITPPGGRMVVIQTVSGKPLESGGEDIRYDPVGGQGRHTGSNKKDSPFTERRIPIKALKGRHVDILKAAMAANKAPRLDPPS